MEKKNQSCRMIWGRAWDFQLEGRAVHLDSLWVKGQRGPLNPKCWPYWAFYQARENQMEKKMDNEVEDWIP